MGGMNRQKDIRLQKVMVRSTIRMFIPLNNQREAFDIQRSESAQVQFELNCMNSRWVLLTIEIAEEPPETWFDEIPHMSGLEANVQLDHAPDHRDP